MPTVSNDGMLFLMQQMYFCSLLLFQVSTLGGRNHLDLPALQKAQLRPTSPEQTGAGGLLDGLSGGGNQKRCLLRPIPCKSQGNQ